MADPQDPPWLTPDETDAWLALLSVVVRLPTALGAQLQRDSGLSHFEYQVLAGLSQTEGATLRLKRLAVLTDGSLSRLSQVVTRLEQHGWVRREPDPEDGRSTLAVLTDAGQEKLTEAAPGHVTTVRALVFDPLTRAQVAQLADIGRRITRALDPGNTDLDRHRKRRP